MNEQKKYSAPRWHDNPIGKASVIIKSDKPLAAEDIENNRKFEAFIKEIQQKAKLGDKN